ncbi:MAG TPA: DUF2807 domain-containing protein [Geminicoccaceae bacterium]|jgi:hypothetical protein|nr:DUF2807 domain-containing protein [Geminicoccaceae bacterium]
MKRMGFAILLLSWLVSGSAGAAATTVEHGPFTVDRVALLGLRGTLRVEVVAGATTTLHVEGPEAAVAALEVTEGGGGLEVRAPAGGNSVTVIRNLTVVTGPGASSSVTIGGAAGSAAETEPLDLVLELPKGTGLTLDGFVGEAEIGDLEAEVAIGVVEGRVTVGAVRSAGLATVGAATIGAASVDGDLEVSVTGDGAVEVAAGEVGAARLTLTGAGSITVDAPIETAEVSMVGAGTVRLAKVAAEPSVQRVGAGELHVGPP